MNNNDLRSLLYDALGELRVLASYLDSDYPWPNAGLRMTALAHDRMVKRIEAALAVKPGEEIKGLAKARPLKMAMPEGWNTTPDGPYEGE